MSASLLRRLVELGAPDDLIDEVADLISNARLLSKRREADRDRQKERRSRDRHVTSRDTADISDVADTPFPSLSPNEILNPNPTHTREYITPARDGDPELPDGASAEQWRGFVEMRRRIRKPLTARAQQLALAKLRNLADSGQPPGAVLDQSTLNSWQDLFPIKEPRNANWNSGRSSSGKTDGFLSALREVGGRSTG